MRFSAGRRRINLTNSCTAPPRTDGFGRSFQETSALAGDDGSRLDAIRPWTSIRRKIHYDVDVEHIGAVKKPMKILLQMSMKDPVRITKSSHHDFPQMALIDEGSPRQCLRVVDLGFGRERR
jgi:hypothetical protein